MWSKGWFVNSFAISCKIKKDMDEKLQNLENFTKNQIFTMWRGCIVWFRRFCHAKKVGVEEANWWFKRFVMQVERRGKTHLHTFIVSFHQTIGMQLKNPISLRRKCEPMHRPTLDFKRNFSLNQHFKKITYKYMERKHKSEEKMRKKHANLARRLQ